MLLTNIKTTKVILFGKEYLISARSTRDVFKLIAFSKQKINKDYTDYITEALICLSDGLKINYSSLKWYSLIKKIKLKRIFSMKNLFCTLSAEHIFRLSSEVVALENVTDDTSEKKKIVAIAEHE